MSMSTGAVDPGRNSVTISMGFWDSRDEALLNAREAIAVYLDELRARGEQIPREVRTETQFLELPELEYGT